MEEYTLVQKVQATFVFLIGFLVFTALTATPQDANKEFADLFPLPAIRQPTVCAATFM